MPYKVTLPTINTHKTANIDNVYTIRHPSKKIKLIGNVKLGGLSEAIKKDEFAKVSVLKISKKNNTSSFLHSHGKSKHNDVINAVNSLSEEEIDRLIDKDSNLEYCINFLNEKTKFQNGKNDHCKKLLENFDIDAHNYLTSPDRNYVNKEKIISFIFNGVSVLAGASAGIGTQMLYDQYLPNRPPFEKNGVSNAVSAAVTLATRTFAESYTGKLDHDKKLKSEHNNVLFRHIQSVASNRKEGMDIFHKEYNNSSKFKLNLYDDTPVKLNIDIENVRDIHHV